MDVRPGGRARFDMTSGDGTVYTNRFDYIEVVPGEKLVLDLQTMHKLARHLGVA
jgi:uncharacterized protein YndB with AHSA1/START domain